MMVDLLEALLWAFVGGVAVLIPSWFRHLLWNRRFRRKVERDELLNPE